MKVYAVILCGGSGQRMGLGTNKTLLPVGGVPAAIRCVRAFREKTDGIVLVVKAGEEALFSDTLRAFGETVHAVVPGGGDRQSSALAGLRALPDQESIALIHDGARPFVTGEIIDRVIAGVLDHGAAAAAVPVRDTVKRADEGGLVLETLDRSELWQMQTPQGAMIAPLLRAHRVAPSRYTDDAALMEAAGHPVQLVMGSYDNIKLTSPEDLRMAENLTLPRIGHGYDVHQLTPGRKLILGGVEIPYEKGLLGHSDADAALHALMDALLGAAGLPDIGRLFPDNDPAYAGISSLLLLEKVAGRLRQAGFTVGNCDVTIIAQAPKMAPHIAAMRKNTARALGVPEEKVNFKATTTERLGFEGEGKGISAHAVALVFT